MKNLLNIVFLMVLMICEVIFTTVFADQKNFMNIEVEEPRKLIAVVGDFKIYQDELDAYSLILQGDKAQSIEDPELLEVLILQFATQEALAQEAMSRGLDKRLDYIASIKMFAKLFLEDILLEDMVSKGDISLAKIQEEYARNTVSYEGRRYRFSQIVVKTEEEAKQIIAKINNGDITFVDAVSEYSLDLETARNNGQYSSLLKTGAINPRILPTILEMEEGDMSIVPVKSELGYHILLLNYYQDFKAPSFDELDEIYLYEIARPAFLEYKHKLQENMKVKILADNEFFE